MKNNSSSKEDLKTTSLIRKKTVISFAVFILAFAFAFVGWRWLMHQPEENGALKPLRKILDANEKVNAAFFNEKNLAPEYPKSMAAKQARVNGDVGMGDDFDASNWKLTINRHPGNNATDSVFQLTMDDIKALPKRDLVFDFKCIEGWNQISHWGGTKFSDFLIKYRLGTRSGKAPDPNNPEDLYKYVGLMTPDKAYYVGIDMKSMLQDQTILCYELNEKPLPMNQGYPLRLIITVKYGIKSLKRIGYIYFSDTRPPDYWYERGYDYDSAL
ncbi:molybdopterin-dependent oxidoreductase [Flavobacterium sp. W1B]|uniref:molybdopterin-dependent oxidoreductase n=1 Tax=Flavobacterium sp. W1B TaxID=3394146 RepID=UPI0039BCBC1D